MPRYLQPLSSLDIKSFAAVAKSSIPFTSPTSVFHRGRVLPYLPLSSNASVPTGLDCFDFERSFLKELNLELEAGEEGEQRLIKWKAREHLPPSQDPLLDVLLQLIPSPPTAILSPSSLCFLLFNLATSSPQDSALSSSLPLSIRSVPNSSPLLLFDSPLLEKALTHRDLNEAFFSKATVHLSLNRAHEGAPLPTSAFLPPFSPLLSDVPDAPSLLTPFENFSYHQLALPSGSFLLLRAKIPGFVSLNGQPVHFFPCLPAA